MLEKNCSCQNSTLKVNDLYSVYSSTLYTYSARLSSFVWGEISWTPWWVAVSSSEKAALCFVLYWMFWKRKKKHSSWRPIEHSSLVNHLAQVKNWKKPIPPSVIAFSIWYLYNSHSKNLIKHLKENIFDRSTCSQRSKESLFVLSLHFPFCPCILFHLLKFNRISLYYSLGQV